MDLQEAYPDEVNKVVTLIDDLFEIERKARTWDELKKLRAAESDPKLDEIKATLQDIHATFFDRDDLCKAAPYVLTGWTEFTAFTKDIRIPLSNDYISYCTSCRVMFLYWGKHRSISHLYSTFSLAS